MAGDLTAPEGNPGAVSNAAGSVGSVATDLGKRRSDVQTAVSTALSDWRGPRRDAFKQAGAGLQVELSLVQTSAQKVAGLIHEYGLALKKTQDDIRQWAQEVNTAEGRANDADPDSPDGMRAEQLRAQLESQARAEAAKLQQLAQTIASEVDAETNTLVPKSSSLTPAQINRQVLAEYGVSGLSGTLTADQAWGALNSAQAAVPEEDVKVDGEVDWKELADQINNAGPAQLLAGVAGPLAGAEGWAVTRYAENVHDVAAVEKNVQEIFSEMVGPMSDLYKSGIAGMGDVDASLDAASEVAQLERTLAGNPEEQTASLLSKLKAGGIPESGFLGAAGRVLAVVGVFSDVLTIANPGVDNKAEAVSLQGAAGLNIAGTAAAFAPGLAGLVGINAVADWIPVAGQVVMIGTALYLAGDWAYHHVQWFHDGVNAVGHTVAAGAEHVWNGIKDVGSGVAHVFSSIF